jgi:hypothetical protein
MGFLTLEAPAKPFSSVLQAQIPEASIQNKSPLAALGAAGARPTIPKTSKNTNKTALFRDFFSGGKIFSKRC